MRQIALFVLLLAGCQWEHVGSGTYTAEARYEYCWTVDGVTFWNQIEANKYARKIRDTENRSITINEWRRQLRDDETSRTQWPEGDF